MEGLYQMVGAARFELATPCTPCRCAPGLRHAPTSHTKYHTVDFLFNIGKDIRHLTRSQLTALSPPFA